MPCYTKTYALLLYHLCEFTSGDFKHMIMINPRRPAPEFETTKMKVSSNNENEQLGNLLIDADIVPSDMVEIALQISAGFGQSLGQVLVDTNRISSTDLQNVLRAQALVNDGTVDEQEAARALHLAHRTRLAFGDAVVALFPMQKAA